MPEISKITLPSGTTYDIKDTVARSQTGGAIIIRGTTTTALEDESTANPIVINSEYYTAVANDAVFYGKKEFVYDGTMWHEFGDMSGLGSLATKDSAQGQFTPSGSISVNSASGTGTSYTPEGTVAAPTISVASAGSTATIKNPTKATVATAVTTAAPGSTAPSNPITYYSVSNETLSLYQIGYNTGDSISTEDVTVKTGDASYSASAPAFTGTEKKLAFTGTEGTVTVS